MSSRLSWLLVGFWTRVNSKHHIVSHSIRLVILSQCRDLRTEMMWDDLRALRWQSRTTVCRCRCYSANDGSCHGRRLCVRVCCVLRGLLFHRPRRTRRYHVHRSCRLRRSLRRLRFHQKPVDSVACGSLTRSVSALHLSFQCIRSAWLCM